ncbi:hypothetical protein BH20ACI3_BH20ACI3_25130 [soil metagenome]
MASSMAERILMSSAVPPIFVIDDDDVIVYESVEVDLEPLDVKAGGLVAYDAEGRLLRLETNRGEVTVSVAEEKPTHAAELEFSLRKFLKASDEPLADDPACDLKCLVNVCRKFITSPDLSDLLKKASHKIGNMFRK